MSDGGKDVLAVVIGRAGSKGLPGKNALLLAGRPMITYSIEHALEAESVDRVIVSTDGREIAAAAEAMGVQVIMRPGELADDHSPIDGAVRHAVEAGGMSHEVIVILYGNVPIRPGGLIDRAVKMLRETGADSVQSYCNVGKHHPYWMVRLDEAQRVHAHQPNAVYRRQDLPRLLLPDGGVIAVRREGLFCEAAVKGAHPHAFLGEDRRGIEVEAGAVVDVDTPLDFAIAEVMKRQGGSDEVTK